MDFHLAMGLVVSNAKEETNPPIANQTGVTIAVGGRTKKHAGKKCALAPQEAIEVTSS